MLTLSHSTSFHSYQASFVFVLPTVFQRNEDSEDRENKENKEDNTRGAKNRMTWAFFERPSRTLSSRKVRAQLGSRGT